MATRFSLILTVAGLLFLSSLSAQAQTSIALYNGGNQEVGVAFLKPSFENDSNLSFLSSAWYFYGRFPVGVNVAIIADIPLSFVSEEGGGESEFMLGNPMVGVEIDRPVSPMYAQFGVRLPLSSDNNFAAALFGIFSDYDNFTAFTPDIIPVVFRAGRRDITPTGFYSNILLGGELIFYTEENFGDDNNTELVVTYQALAGYDTGSGRFAGGITGVFLASDADGSFADNSFHQFTLQATSNFNQFRPGIFIRLPLDEDLSDLINFVFGLTLSVDLNG